MNNPEFEPEMDDIDISGYSEKKTDLKIDKVNDSGNNVKQFNRLTKTGTFVPKKHDKKKNEKKIQEETVFELK